ncbi:MAG: UvrD-helicase domain-containing protein [Myxococcales bacterium]|nr:UvrD-helicase domain-containing protein [Myxococcales bacterium]
MKIVAPRRLLQNARRTPDLISRALARLEGRAPARPGEGVAEVLEDQRVLGVRAQPDALELCFLAAIPHTAALGTLPPLASVSRLELEELGVPADLHAATRAVERLEALDRLPLVAEVASRVRFRLLQLAPHLLPSPARADRQATSRTHLDRYLRGELEELMLHLDPAQERIVELDGSGAIVVRGVAGSGKTAVALHRVFRLLAQRSLLGGPRLLFVTFNRALASAARQLTRALGLATDDLEIATLHGFCRALVPGGRLLEAGVRRLRLRQARAEVEAQTKEGARLWTLPDAFWEDEIALIKSRVTGGLEAYLALRRHGAARALEGRHRTLVFQVMQAYDRLCAAQGELDFDEVVRRAYEHLLAQGEAGPRYDHVLVDEAQDFPPLGLRIAAHLARAPGHVFVAYDPAQSLYRKGFRWKDSGLLVHGARSIDLHRNFRNTREILETAYRVFPGSGASRAADEGDAPLRPEPPERTGPPVVHVVGPSGQEVDALLADLKRRILAGLAPGRVAILSRRNHDLIKVERALAAMGLSSCRHGRTSELRLADPGVKLLTFHSAKGLEFPVVYVLADARSLTLAAPHAAEGQPTDPSDLQRLLYVAMTRATSALVVVTTEGALPAFLAQSLAPSSGHA